MAKWILIDKSENKLRLYEDSTLLHEYPVGTGKTPEITPEGTFPIVFKTTLPGWTNPITGEFIPGGSPHNPLGTRWLGLSAGAFPGHSYGIHGTNQPWTVGHYISLGCVRMFNWDVEQLYDLVPLGTPVTIQP